LPVVASWRGGQGGGLEVAFFPPHIFLPDAREDGGKKWGLPTKLTAGLREDLRGLERHILSSVVGLLSVELGIVEGHKIKSTQTFVILRRSSSLALG
jgi:hypothetical protein